MSFYAYHSRNKKLLGSKDATFSHYVSKSRPDAMRAFSGSLLVCRGSLFVALWVIFVTSYNVLQFYTSYVW